MRLANKRRKSSHKPPKAKKVKHGNTEKDVSTPEPLPVSGDSDANPCNYRRFSSRNKKKTEFFSPIERNTSLGNGKEVDRAAILNNSYRRALQFSEKQLVQSLQNAWPQLAANPEKVSLKIAEEENKFLAPLLGDGGPMKENIPMGSGRCIHREPMLEVSLWVQGLKRLLGLLWSAGLGKAELRTGWFNHGCR